MTGACQTIIASPSRTVFALAFHPPAAIAVRSARWRSPVAPWRRQAIELPRGPLPLGTRPLGCIREDLVQLGRRATLHDGLARQLDADCAGGEQQDEIG